MEVKFTDELFLKLRELGVKTVIIDKEKNSHFKEYMDEASNTPNSIVVKVDKVDEPEWHSKVYGVKVIVK